MTPKTVTVLVAAAVLAVLLAAPAAGMKNPAAVYCGAMGYTYTTEDTPDGTLGLCRMPDGTTVDAWRFLQGSAGQQYSYCARQGYRQQVVRSYRTCGAFCLDECLVCVLPDGRTAEVTQLMNLSFAETSCGDGSCGMPETVLSCPADCVSGGWDNLCDGKRDGRCDPDCPDGAGDPDCGGSPPFLLYLAGIAVLAAAVLGIFLFLKQKRSS